MIRILNAGEAVSVIRYGLHEYVDDHYRGIAKATLVTMVRAGELVVGIDGLNRLLIAPTMELLYPSGNDDDAGHDGHNLRVEED